MAEKQNPPGGPVAGKIGATTTRGGRPCKLTPELQAKLIEVISNGGYYEIACRSVGIRYMTFRNWMKRGAKATSGEFFDFFEAIKKAEAQLEMELVVGWGKLMEGDWKAIATFLERRWPERWSRDRLQLQKHEARIRNLERQLLDRNGTSMRTRRA